MNYKSHSEINSTTVKLRRTVTIIKICTLAIGLQAMLLYADSQPEADVKAQDSQQNSDTTTPKTPMPVEKVKVDDSKAKAIAAADKKALEDKKAKLNPIKTTLFVNGRVNDIVLVITDDKNKQFKIQIKAGMHYSCGHKPQALKKVVCHEINTPSVTLSQSDLNGHSVFVFNTDQKLEKYNFITIQQKNLALKHARESKNETLFHEISDQPVYHP
ncbi:MAG: hypothetical protein Q8Q60_04830 [Candidatus Chromulinivorax sp.]|nr:hypothetical protein [Candidatus Chromulinivorax sp.]